MTAKNEALVKRGHAGMVREELIGGRLCAHAWIGRCGAPADMYCVRVASTRADTGPLYMKYNAVLRFFGGKLEYIGDDKPTYPQVRLCGVEA